MEKIAIIDLGSNSARLVLVNVLDGGYFYVYDELKETVRLAQDFTKDGELNSIRVEQTIMTLKMFRDLCVSNNVDKIYPFATAAVRRAKNQKSFLEEVYFNCGFKLKVLDHDEECNLVYRGVINSIDVPKGLIMDIGGGSTQLILYNRRNIIGYKTLPYGAVNLTEMFKNDLLKPEERAKQIEDFIFKEISKIDFIANNDFQDTALIGVGGSYRNLGKIIRKMDHYPLDMTHNFEASKNSFYAIYNFIKKLELDKTMKIKGLSSVRADIFPSALAAMAAVFKKCDFEKVIISGSGLREGAMFAHAVPSTKDKPIPDVLGHSIYTILNKFGENIEHSEQVFELSRQLFDQLKVLHKLQKPYLKILRTAAMLHDIGNRVNYYDHHKHSMYIILNSRINGLTHREVIMAAFVAGLHRKDEIPAQEFEKYKDVISREDVDTIMKLGVLLRIAESLDRSMSSDIKTIQLDVLGDSVIMKTESEKDCTLEIKDALKATDAFKKAYKKNLQIL